MSWVSPNRRSDDPSLRRWGRLSCDVVLYDERAQRVACTSAITTRPTAALARQLARQLGWRYDAAIGDRCPLPGHQPNRVRPDRRKSLR